MRLCAGAKLSFPSKIGTRNLVFAQISGSLPPCFLWMLLTIPQQPSPHSFHKSADCSRILNKEKYLAKLLCSSHTPPHTDTYSNSAIAVHNVHISSVCLMHFCQFASLYISVTSAWLCTPLSPILSRNAWTFLQLPQLRLSSKSKKCNDFHKKAKLKTKWRVHTTSIFSGDWCFRRSAMKDRFTTKTRRCRGFCLPMRSFAGQSKSRKKIKPGSYKFHPP